LRNTIFNLVVIFNCDISKKKIVKLVGREERREREKNKNLKNMIISGATNMTH
jgi:hypothetical protein